MTTPIQTRKPKLLMNGHTDEIYTPAYALNPLLPYLKKEWIIWECAWGEGSLAKHLTEKGYKIIGSESIDFLSGATYTYFDCLITNPPYSKKEEFLKKAFEIGKPFAFLLPLTALEGKERGEMYRKYNIQLIIPNRRINFITPNGGKSSWFATAWFCYGLNLPNQLNFVELER
jgi:hypothetical protein